MTAPIENSSDFNHRELRRRIRDEVASIEPLDDKECHDISNVLSWIDSGAELCRLKKPATPPKHLIAYFAVVDGDHVLLVDHINAELWLPTGGHVDPGEHPVVTVRREAQEELGLAAEFLTGKPLFLTVTETVGKTAGHTDVSIWYALRADRHAPLTVDTTEFHDVRWFCRDEIPLQRSDPQMARFIRKLYAG